MDLNSLGGLEIVEHPSGVSPDPLLSRPGSDGQDDMYYYSLTPVEVHADNAEALTVSSTEQGVQVSVRGIGSLQCDFGVEAPAWLEFDSANFVPDPPPDLVGSWWLWSDDVSDVGGGRPRGELRYFTKDVRVDPSDIRSAHLVVAADHNAEVFVNGRSAGRTVTWRNSVVIDITALLDASDNRILACATSAGGAAGFVAVLRIRRRDGREEIIRSDASWGVSARPPSVVTDGAKHSAAASCQAMFGGGPWGSEVTTYDLGIQMAVSEYNEVQLVNPGPVSSLKAGSPHLNGFTYRLELNAELLEGVRFGWINILTHAGTPWTITAIRLVCRARRVNYRGSFECSSRELTNVWYTGAYTVRANMGPRYITPILVDRGDRGPAGGDAYTMQACALAAFGAYDAVLQNMELIYTKGDDYPNILSFRLYEQLSLCDYFWHSGDKSTAERWFDTATAALERAVGTLGDPQIGWYGWDERLGGGFNEPQQPECVAAYQALFVRTCRQIAAMARELGRPESAEWCEERAREWLAYAADDPVLPSLGVHALADWVNAGLAPTVVGQVAIAREFGDRVTRRSYSPFNQYFILEALTQLGMIDEALVTVLDIWGGQIDYGGTTYFEVFRPEWAELLPPNSAVPGSDAGATSLAHGWGGGVTAWLSHHVLGIRPLTPGFGHAEIAPHLGTRLTSVGGSMPTPHGAIEASFDLQNGIAQVSIPPGVVARVGIPTATGTIEKVSINDEVCWDPTLGGPRGQFSGTQGDGFVFFEELPEGLYNFTFRYAATRVPEPQDQVAYPSPPPALDRETGGEWTETYGARGYLLFNFDGELRHRLRAPNYLAGWRPHETPHRWGDCYPVSWDIDTTDARALRDPDQESSRRSAAGWSTDPPNYWGFTMSLDLQIEPADIDFKLSLYMVDWDRQRRRTWIEIYDLATRKLLAAPVYVEDFAQGVYVTYQCQRSVRVRLKQIGAPSAVLSAVFFD